MKFLKSIILLLITALLFSVIVSADTKTRELHWYCNKTSDHSRPPAPVDAPELEEYNTVYLGEDEKCVYLTFDLGYENENVESILDTLKEEKVPATFFLLRHVVVSGKLLPRIIEEGHLCANHTAHHKNMAKMGDIESFAEELSSIERQFEERFGTPLAKLWRAPEGAYSEQVLHWANELGYKTVFWSVAIPDWDENNQLSPEVAKRKLLDRVHNGAIILLHPTSSSNAKMLGDFIRELKSEGYEFKTL